MMMSNVLENNPPLPAITADGNNTFGCLVNNNIFSPNPIPGQQRSVFGELQYYNKITGINIYVDDFISNRALILFLYNPAALTMGEEYNLSDAEFFIQYLDFNKPPACSYRSGVTGTIRIHRCDLHDDHKIISGTFNFTLQSEDCDEVIHVTAGRFDVSDIAR